MEDKELELNTEVLEEELEKANIIKVKAYLNHILFPKFPKVLGEDDNTYGITLWEVVDDIEGQINGISSYGTITVKGDFFFKIETGQLYVLTAKEVLDEKYGVQYELIYINEDIDLTQINQQKKFLKSFLSDNQIKEFYKIYENPLKVIAEENIEALCKVKGVQEFTARAILKRFNNVKDLSAVYLKLNTLGLTPLFIKKLLENLKSPEAVVEVIKTNPYQLIKEVKGISFRTADKLALANGVNPKSTNRIKAYIQFYLEEEGEAGNSYVTASELLLNIYNEFGGKEEIEEKYYDDEGNVIGNNIGTSIQELQEENIISIEDGENKARRRVYLNALYNLERDISFHLKRLLSGKNYFDYHDWREKVAALEEIQGFKFSQEQIDGIKLGLDNQVCFISGLAGTGKSSLVSGILAALDGYSFAQTSLSGKAAARLQEVTGKPGQTIHRLLGYNPEGGFFYNEGNYLNYDIIILDEISLVGGKIFDDLIKAIPTTSKLIMLGDMGQLESIGALNLANDLYHSPIIPTVELKEVHRQAQKSGILTSAYSVRNQEQLFNSTFEGKEVRGELEDMIFDISQEKDNIRETTLKYFKENFESDLVHKDIMNIQLLSPVKSRGNSCVHELNIAIQDMINPVDENSSVPKMHIKKKKNSLGKDESFWIQAGDKVMCIKNNYQTYNEDGIQTPIFNGWTGIVENITENDVLIRFPLADNKIVYVPKDEAKKDIILGYASTIHKCVTGDTWIITKEKGPIQIRDIEESDIGHISVLNNNYYEKPIKLIVNPPYQNLVRITSESGRHVTGTLDHKVLTYNQFRKEFDFIEFKYINVGDWIYVEKDFRDNRARHHLQYQIESVAEIEVLPPEPTYSLEMPHTHLIVENGIICHNCQGSDYPAIIGVLDYSTPPQMLTSQLVYTLLTRAKKKCWLVAQNGALRKAISTDFVSTKRTFLQEFLLGK